MQKHVDIRRSPMPYTVFVPVYEHSDNKFFLLCADFYSTDKKEARKIGLGSMFCECFFYGMKYTHEVIEIEVNNCPHAKALLGDIPIAIISGPLFEEAKKVGEIK